MTHDPREALTAAYQNTDDADPALVLAAVRHCALSWDGDARLLGNVRAKDIVRAIDALSNPPAAVESNASVEAIIAEIDTYSLVHGVLVDDDRKRMAKLKSQISAIVAKNASAEARLREALYSIRQFGSDTLSGRTDGPDDRKWQRDAVIEITRRAQTALSAVGAESRKSEDRSPPVGGYGSVEAAINAADANARACKGFATALERIRDGESNAPQIAVDALRMPWCTRGLTSEPTTEREEIVARLLTTAKLLLQNAVGCAANHHSVDFEQQGLPGWLADCERDIRAASAALDALSAENKKLTDMLRLVRDDAMRLDHELCSTQAREEMLQQDVEAAESRATRAEQERDEAYERLKAEQSRGSYHCD